MSAVGENASLTQRGWTPLATVYMRETTKSFFVYYHAAQGRLQPGNNIEGVHPLRGLGGVVGLMLLLALAAAVRVPYTTSPCSDLGQVVNLSLSVAWTTACPAASG